MIPCRQAKHGLGSAGALVSILCINLAGCGLLTRRAAVDVAALDAEDLFYRINRSSSRLKSFQGSARVQLVAPGNSFEAQAQISMKMPDTIHVRFEVTLGIDIGIFFATPDTFIVYSPQENTVYTGAMKPGLIARYFQFPFDFEELVEGFTGLVRLPYPERGGSVEKTGTVLLIQGDRHGFDREYQFAEDAPQIGSYRVLSGGDTEVITKRFKHYSRVDGVNLPRITVAERPQRRERLTVYYTRRRINEDLPGNAFRLPIPESAEWVWMR